MPISPIPGRTTAPIPSSVLKGYLAEAAATNLCLQSQEIVTGTTWSYAGVTVGTASTGPDGTTSAKKIVEDASNGVHFSYQTITVTAAAYTFSCYLKAAERTWGYIRFNTGGANEGVHINLSTGVLGTVSGAGATATVTSVGNGWYRLTYTRTATATTWNPVVGPATADATFTYQGVAGSGIYMFGAQLELGSAATSYIPTTTAAVTRNADVLTYPSAGNIDGTVGWCSAEITLDALKSGSNQNIIHTNTSGIASPMYRGTTGLLSLYDGTSERQGSALTPAGIAHKTAATWGGSSSAIALDGTVTTVGFDGSMTHNLIGVGVSAGGTEQLLGNIGNVRIGQRQLSSSELQAITR